MNSGRVELLDRPKLVAQLCGLERRTARRGGDSIDHGVNSHDDIANSLAGVCVLAAARRRTSEFSGGYDVPVQSVDEQQRKLEEQTAEAAARSATDVEETIKKVGVWGFDW